MSEEKKIHYTPDEFAERAQKSLERTRAANERIEREGLTWDDISNHHLVRIMLDRVKKRTGNIRNSGREGLIGDILHDAIAECAGYDHMQYMDPHTVMNRLVQATVNLLNEESYYRFYYSLHKPPNIDRWPRGTKDAKDTPLRRIEDGTD